VPLYFCVGAGVWAGLAGADLVCEVFVSCNTECGPACREAATESVIDVSMNMIADHVVAFDKAVAAPLGPKAVWLPIPPNAAATSPLLPLCSSTTMIRNNETMT